MKRRIKHPIYVFPKRADQLTNQTHLFITNSLTRSTPVD